jgi:acyl-CoA thioesterase II
MQLLRPDIKAIMNIDHYLALAQTHKQNPEQEFTISKEWSQGRTVYGGVSAAMLYASVKPYIDEDRVLRSMSTNFVGPLISNEPFSISVEIVRSGKNVSQLQSRAIQNGKVCVLSQLCFGAARPSKVEVINTDKHNLSLPTKAKYFPPIPKLVPSFLKHFDLCIQEGGAPFLGSKSSHYYGWMRYKTPPMEINEAHIIGLIDVWPPTLLQMLKWPAPASTVSWNLEFIYPHREILTTDWFAYKAETRQASCGYGHTEATIWDTQGEVVAISRQTVAIFD